MRKLNEEVYSNIFAIRMVYFESTMAIAKAGWANKWEKMEKKNIQWKLANNKGNRFDGKYEGQMKGDVPHGLGKWKIDGGNDIVEGEWKDGLLNGRVVVNHDNGDHE